MYLVDTPGIIVPKLPENTDHGLKLSVCHSIRDGIVDDALVCDYLLFRLNKASLFTYVNRYNLPDRKPTDDIHTLLHSISIRMGLQN